MSEIAFVQRDEAGKIVGVYGCEQPGYAVEKLPRDGAEVAAFLNPPAPLPSTVTPRQARLALFAAGLLDVVEAAVNRAGGETQITWEYATEINRTDPLIATLADALGLKSDQIDALFVTAAAL